MRPLTTICLMAALAVLPIACAGETGNQTDSDPRVTFHTSKGSVTLKLEVARSLEERKKGLMGRSYLEPGTGMVFIWESPTETPFWMKDTLIPLSIAFIAENGKVVDIQDMEPQTLIPHAPAGQYFYAVESNRGFFEENGVTRGDYAVFADL